MKSNVYSFVWILSFAFIVVLFARPTEGQQKEYMNAGDLVKAHADAWNKHNVDSIDNLFTEDGIYEDVAAGQSWQGKNDIKNLIKSTLKAIPDFKVKITNWFSAKDKVSCQWVMSGTQTGDFPDHPATGKSFSVHGTSVVLLEDGKIKHWSDYYDMYSFLHQVGAIPAPESKDDTEVEKNKAMVKKYIEEMNNGDEDFLNEYLADNYVYHGQNGDLDKAGFKAQHHMIMSAFSNIKISAEIVFGDGDKVATRWKMHGKNTGEFNGIPPTGKEFTVTGNIISRFVDGKEVEAWEEVNQIGMMQQLGLMK